MNVIAEIDRINARELELGVPLAASWHQKYKESAWVYVGGLPYELTEGDVLCVMSQFGELEDINLVRDAETGKSKGFAFLKYENWLSTVLAVDNMNGARLLERVIRVDHVLQYKLPKEVQDRENEREAQLLASSDSGSDSSDGERDDVAKKPRRRGLPGHAYEGKELANALDLGTGHNVFDAPEETREERRARRKREKKAKKENKKTKKLEKKQSEWMAVVRKQREAQRAQEAALAAETETAPATALPSETGWRGRLEPSVDMGAPKRSRRQGQEERRDGSSFEERERKRRAAYGGINRVR